MKKSTFFTRFFGKTRLTGIIGCIALAAITQPIVAQTIDYTASLTGDINASATWGGTSTPASNDGKVWSIGAITVKVGTANNSSITFNGGTLNIASGGILQTAFQNPTLTLNNLTLNGGKILVANLNGFTLDLPNTNKTLTLNSGYILTNPSLASTNIVFKNATLAGNGNITIASSIANATNLNYVEFQNTVTTSGFTGIFTVVPGVYNATGPINGNANTLKINATTSGTFGVSVPATSTGYTSSNKGKLWNASSGTLTLVSLNLGGTDITPSATPYQYSDFLTLGPGGTSLQGYLNSATGTITVTGAVNAPTAVVATPLNASASVAFTAPVNTAGYALATTPYTVTPHDVVSNTDGTPITGASSPILVTGLTNNRSYTFTVKATNKFGIISLASTASSAVTPVVVPNAPTNVVGTPGDAQASVAFTASVANGSTIDHYTVTPYVGATAGTPVTGSGSPIVVTGLNNGVEYTFQVVAVDLLAGSSSAATSATVIPAGVESYWDGTVATGFGTQALNAGESEANPILIRTPMQWMYAANLAAAHASRALKFKLTENLNFKNLANAKTFGPLTSGAVFDGAGYTVSNIILNSTTAVQGLFTTLTSATVKNLGLTGTGNISGIAGSGAIACTATSATINNCYNTTPVSGDIVSAQSGNTKAMNIGGIAAICNGTTIIQDCFNTGAITGVARVAGIASSISGTTTSISRCYNTGTINAVYRSGAGVFGDTGGIIGYIGATTTPTTVESCYNTGNVTVTGGGSGNQQVGGIVGNGVSASISINNCYNTGTISLDNSLPTINVAAAGGISGSSVSTLSNCYNTGTVQFTGGIVNTNIGGIIGQFASKNVPTNCYTLAGTGYNDGNATAPASTTVIKTVGELQASGFYTTLNNSQSPAKWMDNPNGGYPVHVYKTSATPDAPGAVTATPSSGQVSVAFTAPIYTGTSVISNYTVTTYNGLTVVGSPATASSSPITISGLINGTSYTFTVKANNSTVSSVPGTAAVAACVVADAPTIGTATASASVSGQATVTFTASASNGGSAITGYTATSSPAGGLGTLSGTGSGTITVTGLTGGTAYTFSVKANNAAGASTASASSNSIITVPGAPTIGAASATGVTGTARVAFTAPVGNTGTAITSYTATSSSGGFTGTSATSPIIVSGLTDGTAYTFTVTATNATGTGSASAASNSVTTSVFTVPDAPTGITAAVVGVSGQATVAFTAPASNGGSAITSYTATSSPGGITGSLSQAGSGTITLNGLTNGTAYTFTVKTNNLAGSSVASAASGSVTPYTNPGAPTSVVATAGNAQASVAFTAPASNGGLAITSYTATSSPGSFTGTLNQSGSGAITVTGLTNGTAYTFTVIATNSGGAASATSVATSAVTPDATANIIQVNTDNTTSALTLTPVSDISVASGYTLTVDGTPHVNSITLAPDAKLTIANGKSLTIVGGLTLQSSATATATVLDQNTVSSLSAGSINVQQYLTSGRNWYITCPVSGATSSVFSASSSNPVYSYDETIAFNASSNAWRQIQNTSTALIPTIGYIANIDATVLSNQSNVVTFSGGSLNSGTITTGQNSVPALNYTDNNYKKGFNLVGNPYASYLNWDNVTKTNVMSSIWLRTKVSNTYVFDTYNALGQMGTSNSGISINNHIPPMQAFWVRATGSGASISFDNSMRSHKGSQVIGEVTVNDRIFKSVANIELIQSVLRLQISNGSLTDETILYSNPNALNSFDDYDTPKMFSNNSSLAEIYTVSGNEQLAINGLNTILYDTEMPLGLNTLALGNFSIKASQIANFLPGTQIVLKDYLNPTSPITTDLSDGSSYNFSSDITTNNTTRFALLFHAPSVATGINPETNGNVWISTQNGQLVVNGIAANETTLEVFNALGQKVISRNLTGANVKTNNTLVAGTYLVKLSTGGKSTTRKIIID